MSLPAAIRKIREIVDRMAPGMAGSRTARSAVHAEFNVLLGALADAEGLVASPWGHAYRMPDGSTEFSDWRLDAVPVALVPVYLGDEIEVPMPPPGAVAAPEWVEPPLPKNAGAPVHWVGRSGRVIRGTVVAYLGTATVAKDPNGVEVVLASHEVWGGWPEGAR